MTPNRFSAVEQQMRADFLWATTNRRLQREYPGELVVVHRKQVVAHGTDEAKLLRQAVAAGCPREELVVVEFLPEAFALPPDLLTPLG